MKYNYPVKYALMPIYEMNGWNKGLNSIEPNYEIIGYIVSKCFLIKSSVEYKADGTSKIIYDVVFPYQLSDYRTMIWSKVDPVTNIYNENLNVTSVDCVFSSLKEAKEECETKNNEIIDSLITCALLRPVKSQQEVDNIINNITFEYNDRMSIYRLLELDINKNTEYMSSKEIPKFHKLIEVENGFVKLIPISIYDYITMFENKKFIACNITDEEYDIITKELGTKSFDKIDFIKNRYLLQKKDKRINITDYSKNVVYRHDGIEGIMNFAQDGEVYYLDENMHLYCNENTDDYKMDNSIDPNEFKTVIYTTEKFKDIINAYRGANSIDISEYVRKIQS